MPGRDDVELRTQGVAPSLSLGLGTHTRVTAGGQFVHQDNLPDYGIPGAAWPDGPLVPGGDVAARPVDQATTTAARQRLRRRLAGQLLRAVEHDLGASVQLRNQTRHNKAHRSAVISTIQNPAAFNPATELVTIARQGNERENASPPTRPRARRRHARAGSRTRSPARSSSRTRSSSRRRWSDSARVQPTNIYDPDADAPVIGLNVARTGAFTDGDGPTAGVSVFDAVDLGPRLQLTGGVRVERYDTTSSRETPPASRPPTSRRTTRWSAARSALLFKLTDQGNVYVACGTTKTPPGTAQLHAELAGQQPEQPQRRSADIDATSRSAASGTSTAAGSR